MKFTGIERRRNQSRPKIGAIPMSDASHPHCLKCGQPNYACECDDPDFMEPPLDERVEHFLRAQLPLRRTIPKIYLIEDLWREVKRLRSLSAGQR
jgi:hypothetical protein